MKEVGDVDCGLTVMMGCYRYQSMPIGLGDTILVDDMVMIGG